MLLLPFLLGGVAVFVAGAPTPSEEPLFAGRYWAVSASRTTALVVLLLRTASLIALGTRVAESMSAEGIRRVAGDLRLPTSVVRLLLSALATRRTVSTAAHDVVRAQQLRGVRLTGGILGRARVLPMLIGPLASNLLVEAANRSAALERRCYERFASDVYKARALGAMDLLVLAAVSVMVVLGIWLA